MECWRSVIEFRPDLACPQNTLWKNFGRKRQAVPLCPVLSAECTADDGQTWVSVASVVSIDPVTAGQPHDSSAAHASDPSDSTRTAIDSASTADGFGGTRKLKRISKGEGESKFAKRSAERTERKSSNKVVKPQDLIGAELAGGRYVVKSMLDKGSMAYVFLVSDERLETGKVYDGGFP